MRLRGPTLLDVSDTASMITFLGTWTEAAGLDRCLESAACDDELECSVIDGDLIILRFRPDYVVRVRELAEREGFSGVIRWSPH